LADSSDPGYQSWMKSPRTCGGWGLFSSY